MPQASIITAAYKAEDWIAKAVTSVLNQSFKDWEMLIVADDRIDYAALLADQNLNDSRIHIYTTGGHGLGPAVARNLAVSRASADIVINLDADDTLSSDYLELMIPAAEQYGAATPAIKVVDALSGERITSNNPPAGMAVLKAADLLRYRPTYAPIAYKKSIHCAPWPQLHYGEDLIFWLLLLEKQQGIGYVPEACYSYNYKLGSLSRPDEKDTHKLVQLREQMIAWAGENYRALSKNADLLIEWLESCNEMEAAFNYQLVDIEIYQREVSRRLELILKKAE